MSLPSNKVSVRKSIGNLWQLWNQFWFEKKDGALNLACMRIVLAGTMFYVYFWRSFNMDYFQSESMLPREFALQVFPGLSRPDFAWFFWPDAWAPLVHGIFLILLGLITVGWANRPIMWLTWILHIGFLQRNFSVLFGADVVSGILLLYLSMTKCSNRLRLKFIFFKSVEGPGKRYETDLISSVFYRLIQLQIIIIYAYTGFEKLKGSSWWDGTALWTVLANEQMSSVDLSWLRSYGFFIAVGSFMTLIFEIYFPVMVWLPRMRGYWLTTGLIFHFMIGTLMGLMPFSLVMVSTYFLFPPETFFLKNLEDLKNFWHYRRRGLPVTPT